MSTVTIERTRIRLGDGGAVSAEIARPPAAGDTAVILAHGAGTDMSNALLSEVHQGLAARGLTAVKFNFEYTEQKRRAPDRMPALETCYERVIAQVRAALAPRRLFLGGKSMGGRVASHLAARAVACDGLVFLGYPLHPAGKPQQLRTAHLGAIAVPMLFFAGTRDALCDLNLLRPALAPLSVPIDVHVMEGGDHSFKFLKRVPRTLPVADEICDVTARWIAAR